MTRSPGALQPDPSAIGGVQQPPFARVPDPASLFDVRAQRLAALTEASELKPYLLFLWFCRDKPISLNKAVRSARE
jgi:FdhE protein